MRAVVVTHRNPFAPAAPREMRVVTRPARIRSLMPDTQAPVIALLDGRPLLRPGWRRRLRDGERVDFHVLPLGGNASAGGSNPLTTILSLAVLSFAPWAAAGLLGTTTALVGKTLIGQLTTTAIALGGSALVSALIPAQSSGALSLPTASPTYSLQAQGNSARVDQPIPVQYGRMQFSPDFAAQPYTEYVGPDQFLYQLLCIGAGEFDIEAIKIDDTDLSSFAEITTETIAPGGQVTLFPANVVSSVEVGGQELLGMVGATYAQVGTVLTVTQTAHARAVGQVVSLNFTSGAASDGVFAITGTPTVDTWTVTAPTMTTSGNVNVRSVMGGLAGFAASASATIASRLAIDVILPRGLYVSSGATLTDNTITFTVEAQQIDDFGTPVGAWVSLGVETITDRTTTPIRKSYSYTLGTPGRYAVRTYRRNIKDVSSGSGNDLNWSALRAYLQEPTTYGPVTLLAMRMRATNNLTLQASRMVKVLATRKLPVWNGSSWSAAVATRSLAWAFADAARNTSYGAGLADARIDLAALLALDAVWAARGDSLDGRFDQAGTFWDAAVRIAAAGRAKPFLQGGVLRIVRDDPQKLPVALFSMRNIVRGSFSVDFVLPNADPVDSVQVSYFDAVSWASQRVTGTVPGGTTLKPTKVELFGVTERAQAQREAIYLAAVNKYRRQVVRFATEMDGFIPSIGDMISVQHDMPGWGAQAEAIAWDAVSQTLTLSEPMTFDGVNTYYVGLRRADGSASGPWQVMPGPTAYDVIFRTPPDMTPQVGSESDRTFVAFGYGDTWSARAKVMSVRPRTRFQVEIEAIVDDPSVYTAETGSVSAPINYSSLPGSVRKPIVKPFSARLDPINANLVLLSWEPAPGATIYNIEMAEGNNPAGSAVTWTRVADITSSEIALTLLSPSQTMIRIRGVGLFAGDWTAAALGSLLGRFWNTNPATALWTVGTDPFWRSL